MPLSSDLIAQFVKMTNNASSAKRNGATAFGTVRINGELISVQLDGSNLATPALTTAEVKDGERVTVLLQDHRAIITGNIDSPAARNKDVNGLAEDLVQAKKVIADEIHALNIYADTLDAEQANIRTLVADKVTTEQLNAVYAYVDDLEVREFKGRYAKIEDLIAINGAVYNLESDTANIKTLIFGSATGDVIQTSFSNSVIAKLGDAQIKSAMIDSVAASKITVGDIVTNNVRVKSQNGLLLIADETIRINDTNRTRVQIGKDAANDYSINIWDESGNLMFSKGGITDSAIKEAIIRDDMVSDTANIAANKLDIDSLFDEINGSSKTIKSTHVYLDEQNQTLDVSFKTLSTNVGTLYQTVASQGTSISVLQGQIASKIWQQDIASATNTLSTQYSTLSQSLTSFQTTVGNTYATKNDLNGLTIGVRNLVKQSKLLSAASVGGNWKVVNHDDGYSTLSLSSQVTTWEECQIPLYAAYNEIRGYVTVSFEFNQTANNLLSFNVGAYSATARLKEISNFDAVSQCTVVPITDEWSRAYLTFNIDAINDVDGAVLYKLQFKKLTGYTGSINVRKPKLEIGKKATDWTPAPEDVEDNLSAAETKILQNESSIAGLVSRTTATESAIATLELTADGLTTKVNAAKKQKPHEADGTSGTVGYVGFCTIKVTSTYVNVPITFAISNRGQQTSNVSFCLSSINTADPSLAHIQCDGEIKIWAYKSAGSTWILIAQKSEGYDVIYVNDYSCPRAGLSLTWSDIHYDTLPTSNITEATRLAGKLTKTTVDNAAKTATNYLNFSTAGLVIGDMTASTLGRNVLIDSDSVDIRNGTTVYSSFGDNYLYLAKHSRNATIDLCNGLAKMYHQSRLSYDTLFVIETPNAMEVRGTSDPLCVTSTVATKPAIKFANKDGALGSIGMVASGTESYITRNHPSTASTYSVLDTGNFYKIMDSGYANVIPQSGFTIYSNGNDIKYRKIANLVEVSGVMKPTSEIAGSDTKYTMGILPQTCWPARPINVLCQGSGIYVWMLTVTTGGEIQFSKYRNGDTRIACPVGAWLPFHITYFAE